MSRSILFGAIVLSAALVYAASSLAGPDAATEDDGRPAADPESMDASIAGDSALGPAGEVDTESPVPAAAAPGAASAPIRFPDGSQLPPLNGVARAPDPVWRLGRPYSPIIGTDQRAGLSWYVHEDGSRTTTLMVWREDLGREDAITHVQHPGDPAPVLSEGEQGGRPTGGR